MRFSMVRTALAVLVGAAAISSCSENPISTVKPIEAPTQQASVVAAGSVVISQIYGGGGNTGATYKNDFIEIFNSGTTTVSLAGWSVQYASVTGSTWQVTLLNGSIPAGGYYLVRQAAGAAGTVDLPTPDALGSIAMSGTNGKVALANQTAALTGACPSLNVVDVVGFGPTANCGTPPTPLLSNSTAARRLQNGCKITARPADDFEVVAPTPRNSSSTRNPCGGPPPAEPVVAYVTVTPATASVQAGSPQTFTGTAYTSDDAEIPGTPLTWSVTTAPAGIATVSSAGVVSTTAAGSATVIATTANGSTGTATLTITEPPPPPPPAVPLVITELMANPSGLDSDREWFEVFNPTNAAVDLLNWRIVSNGDAGHTIATSVSVPAGGFALLAISGNTALNGGITPNYVYTNVNLANGSASGSAEFLVLRDPNGSTADSVRWNTYAAVSGFSRVVIDASFDNLAVDGANWENSPSSDEYGTIPDHGTPGAGDYSQRGPIATLTVTPDPAFVSTVGSFQMRYSGQDASGRNVRTPLTWTSSNTAVATVGATTGIVRGVSTGNVVITATAGNGVSDEAILRVLPPGVPATVSLTMNDPRRIPAGYTKPIFATVRDADFNPISPAPALTYSSSDPFIATVDANGYVNAGSVGVVTITATAAASGATGSITITVIPATAPTSALYGDHIEFGIPVDANDADDFLIDKPQYSLSWSTVRGAPNWVSWNINASQFGDAPRCDCFTTDPAAPGTPVHDTDYRNSGYTRGHMVMSESRTTTDQENASTFLLTNIIPQAGNNNSGPWLKLELHLNDLARTQGKEIYVIAGGEYAANPGTLKGEGKVQIPDYTWKVALIMDAGEGIEDIDALNDFEIIVVRIPNLLADVANMLDDPYTDYDHYTVDEIEAFTGYDLLSLLADNIERAAESNTNIPVAAVDGPYTSSEGSSVSMSAAASSDADGHALTYQWSFGDGNVASGTVVSHTYGQDGTYAVQVIVTDILGIADTATTTATVANVAPSVAIANGASLLPGETYTSAGSFTDPGAEAWTATVDYGDGSGTGALALSGQSFSLSHQYNAAGTYTVTVGVSDGDARGTATATIVVIGHAAAVDNLTALVNSNSLKSKLENARRQIEEGKFTPAVNMLEAFINEVEAMVRSGRMSAADGERLIADARRIIQSLIR